MASEAVWGQPPLRFIYVVCLLLDSRFANFKDCKKKLWGNKKIVLQVDPDNVDDVFWLQNTEIKLGIVQSKMFFVLFSVRSSRFLLKRGRRYLKKEAGFPIKGGGFTQSNYMGKAHKFG